MFNDKLKDINIHVEITNCVGWYLKAYKSPAMIASKLIGEKHPIEYSHGIGEKNTHWQYYFWTTQYLFISVSNVDFLYFPQQPWYERNT